MTMKKICALSAAMLMAFTVASCGSKDSSSSKKEDDFSATENVEVASTDKVDAIPEGAETSLLYLGVSDLNPTRANPEKSTELTLFEEKGGSIEYQRTSYFERFDDLAAALLAAELLLEDQQHRADGSQRAKDRQNSLDGLAHDGILLYCVLMDFYASV